MFIKETLEFMEQGEYVRIIPQYYGITFTASWVNGNWHMSMLTYIRSNECSFGNEKTLETEFKRILG